MLATWKVLDIYIECQYDIHHLADNTLTIDMEVDQRSAIVQFKEESSKLPAYIKLTKLHVVNYL